MFTNYLTVLVLKTDRKTKLISFYKIGLQASLVTGKFYEATELKF